jgi:hypothetical protein
MLLLCVCIFRFMARERHSQGRVADDQSAWSPLEAKAAGAAEVFDTALEVDIVCREMPLPAGKPAS